MEQEFGINGAWNWNISRQVGSLQDRAIRLLLTEASHDDNGLRCETVVLFPRGSIVHGSRADLPRATICVSSQPGCGVGCPFCSTGELGYRGNLTTEQIVEQVYLAGVVARGLGRRPRNVVFMGMGEPLHNTEAVLESIEQLTSEKYFGLSPRKITVSTAGVPDQMRRLAQRFPRLRIALSLHSAEIAMRRRLVPRATSDLGLLRETVRKINDLQPSTPVWLEVVLLAGINDGPQDAAAIIEFCRGLRVEVNLIPYNAAAGADQFLPTPKLDRERFAAVLRSRT